ncbi:MAG: hypothetical protein JWM53_2705 [bacterium]|nr:hypothetical protein [bacterium]
MNSRQLSAVSFQLGLLLALTLAASAHADEKRSVAVLEFRAGAKGGREIGLKLARLLRDTAALNVIDVAEARRKLPKVDAEVAKCGGEAKCVGAIGAQLGANELLLVGVSQFGDVIIALQRIDSKRGEAGARLAESLPADKEITDEQALGWLRQLFPPETFRRFGSIAVEADQPGATVTLNGEAAGKTPLAEPVKVRAPATYKLRVEKSGFVPFQARVDVLPDANVEVHASMVRESKDAAWYKRWYVWAIVGGVVAAGGAATAIYFGTRTESTPLGFVQKP